MQREETACKVSECLIRFVHDLRRKGFSVTPVETADASAPCDVLDCPTKRKCVSVYGRCSVRRGRSTMPSMRCLPRFSGSCRYKGNWGRMAVNRVPVGKGKTAGRESP